MKNSKVIIVDDDPNIREGLHAWLSREYTVHCFDSAIALLGVIDNFDFEDGMPTCLLLDFQMPEMTDVELQATLNKKPKCYYYWEKVICKKKSLIY